MMAWLAHGISYRKKQTSRSRIGLEHFPSLAGPLNRRVLHLLGCSQALQEHSKGRTYIAAACPSPTISDWILWHWTTVVTVVWPCSRSETNHQCHDIASQPARCEGLAGTLGHARGRYESYRWRVLQARTEPYISTNWATTESRNWISLSTVIVLRLALRHPHSLDQRCCSRYNGPTQAVRSKSKEFGGDPGGRNSAGPLTTANDPLRQHREATRSPEFTQGNIRR